MAADLELLAPAPPVVQPADLSTKPKFGAALALASYAMLVAAQFLAGVVVMLLGMFVFIARGQDPNGAAFTKELVGQVMVPMLIGAATVSTIVAFVAARVWAWDLVTDRSSSGIGLVPARREQITAAIFVGVVCAAAYLAVSVWLVPYDSSKPLGPLAEAASSGGINRLAWAFLALVFAPLVEEFFFRGLLLRGFTASWGTAAGAIVTGVLFVALHLFEAWTYWPAIVAITTLAAATYFARKWSGSLVPAVAMHLAYNAVIVMAVYTKM